MGDQHKDLGNDVPDPGTEQPEVEGHIRLNPSEGISSAPEDIALGEERRVGSPEDISL